VDAATRSAPDDIRAALAEQVRRPVRWVGCVEAMRASGADLFVEAGPGRVLAGLVRRIDKSLAAQSADDPDTLRSALAATRGTGA
jgi:[acyl-carrier-protein] S-malonyltransferase